ncbi:MAG: radical SAM protein, partial [archaeon]
MGEIANLFLGKPVLAVWEVTKKCNQKCAGCSIPDNTVKNEMSIEKISAVFGKLRKFGIKKVFLQGGDPLAHPKIREIVLMLKGMGFSQSVLTNGILLNQDIINFFDENGISVNVSLDSLKGDVYAAIRGSGTLELVKRNIGLLSHTKNKKAHNVHCTASKMNSEEVFEIKEFAEGLGLHFSVLPYIYNVGIAGKKAENLVYGKEMAGIFKKVSDRCKQKDFLAKIVYGEAIKFLGNEDIGPCDALRYSIYVDSFGLAGPCIEKPTWLDLKAGEITELFHEGESKKVQNCYTNTPCFYGCTRTFSSMAKNKKNIAFHPLETIASMNSVKKRL